ncbi:hypothetical protein [Actinoplanes sp. TFC3]|uniref:hypothetical protein n=1 Tax=Actinoplanes sp. TFC3 TaxID=1710355 RepID=UPI0009E7A739|nr:hypothetical protein [Actinoplanes sp. TFC3]
MRRRTLLALGTSSLVAAPLVGSAAAPASPSPRLSPLISSSLSSFVVQGSDATVRLRPGPASTVLLYAARRFHYEIDTLHPGEVASDAAGTSVTLRPAWYAEGVAGGLLPHQVVVVRDIIAECDGLLAWGGDAAVPSEGRFSLTVAPGDAQLRTLAKRLNGFETKRAQRVGAGVALAYTEARRRRAEKIRKLSRR